LAAGDVLLQLNGRAVGSQSDVFDFLKRNGPFSNVKVRVRRGEQELEKQLVLGRRPETSGHAADRLPGGKSIRRDGFNWIVSHDADVRPEQCGGPVFDLKGQFLGVNIARNSRVRTYVLPRTVLQRFVAGQLLP
jgi:serine protease Do